MGLTTKTYGFNNKTVWDQQQKLYGINNKNCLGLTTKTV